MASNGLISGLGQRMMPFLAILRYDLRGLTGSWLVRIWLAAAAILTLLLAAPAWPHLQTAPLLAELVFPWLIFPWFVVVMVLGVSPISGSQAEALADGFLSRPVTRYEYLLGIWASRVVAVLGVYLLVTVPAVAVVAWARRPVPADHVTFYGILATLTVVGLVLVLQVSLAFLMGTVLRRSLLAITVLLFVWYPVNLILHSFRLEAFSPITLSQTIPTLLRQPWGAEELKEQLAARDVEDLTRQAADFLSVFSSAGAQPAPRKPSFFEQAEFREFSLGKLLLGYGLPTLAAVALATVCFCRRDL